MVSAAGLAHGSSPTRHLFETMEGEGPVAIQLFGAREDDLAFATDLVTRLVESVRPRRIVELNLNAGCPMTKVTREGAGAKLAEDPELIGRLLSAMVANTSLPVTLKTRLGPHPQRATIFEILAAAESAGAKGLIVHARYTSQMHGGAVHLDMLRDIVSRAHIPITGNGSVVDAQTAAAMAATGVDAIMIGRAAVSRPWFFNELKTSQPTPSRRDVFERHLDYLLRFRNQLAEHFPADHIPSQDGFASVKMHVHLFRYFNGLPGAAELRRKLNAVRTLEEIESNVRRYL